MTKEEKKKAKEAAKALKEKEKIAYRTELEKIRHENWEKKYNIKMARREELFPKIGRGLFGALITVLIGSGILFMLAFFLFDFIYRAESMVHLIILDFMRITGFIFALSIFITFLTLDYSGVKDESD